MKQKLISGLLSRYVVEDEERTLPDILVRLTQSLAAVIMGEREKLWLPELAVAPAQQDE